MCHKNGTYLLASAPSAAGAEVDLPSRSLRAAGLLKLSGSGDAVSEGVADACEPERSLIARSRSTIAYSITTDFILSDSYNDRNQFLPQRAK